MFDDMKKIVGLLMLVAGVFAATVKADAQTLKLGIEGISFEPDTVVKETVHYHSAVSVKKKEKSTAIYIGNYKSSSIRLFEYGWNMVERDNPGDFFELNNWKSQQVTINPFNMSITNAGRNVGLSMALGLRFNNYRFMDPVTMEKVGGVVTPVPILKDIKKSKFTTAALHIPAEFTIGKPSRFAVSVGGFADIVCRSHTKIKYVGGNKDKVWNFPVNFIQYGFSARVSCKYVSLYCNWYPQGLFKSGKGPKMEVWSIGIGF